MRAKTDNLKKLGMFLFLWIILISGNEAFAQRGGPPGGGSRSGEGQRRGPSPEQIFGYLDRNKNGRIDADEIENSRGPLKEMMQRAGVDYRKGLDQNSFGKAFEKIRQQREAEGSDRGRDDDRAKREEYERRKREYEERRRREEEEKRRKGEDSKSKSSSKPTVVIRPKERVTVDLPTTFSEGDRDADGQVGFYEWKKWKRDAIGDFAKYDHNGDGFLTPRELTIGPREPVETMAVSGIASTTSASVPTQVATTETDSTDSKKSVTPTEEKTAVDTNSVAGRRAESMFRLLDKDRNESLTSEEWNRSRTIKPLFEKGGIDISQPMSKNDFLSNYIRLSES